MKKFIGKRIISLITALALAAPMAAATVSAEPEHVPEYEEMLAEREREREEQEREREEHERERKEAELERAERRAELGLTVGNEPFPTRPPMPGEVSLMESGYSEVVYISNVEELLAIDGHDGGYYELTADINISGMEWEPLALTNATFNGNGHTISGMTITKEPGYRMNDYGVYYACVSFFDWVGDAPSTENNIYVLDLTLSDINIDITKNSAGWMPVSALGGYGGIYYDGCNVSGKMSIDANSGETDIYGILNGIGCAADLEINGKNNNDVYHMDVTAMENCADSEFNGNINAVSTDNDHISASGMLVGTNCVFNGDINVTNGYADGINGIVGNSYPDGTQEEIYGIGNTFNGNITVSGEKGSACGIYEGIENTFIGSVTGEMWARGISHGENNYLEGDVTAKSDWAYGIYDSSGSTLIGNVTGEAWACGIERGENNYLEGDVTSKGNWAYGIDYSSGSTLIGSVTGEWAEGISGGENNYLEGDVTSNTYAYGIDYSSGSTLIGSVTGERADGIERGENNYLEGDVTANTDDATGIYDSSGSTLIGSVTGERACGIDYGINCTIYGNVTATNSHAEGITGGSGCYISGTITESPSYSPTLTVTAGSPFQGYYRCGYCGSATVSSNDLSGTVHCWSYYTDSNGAVYPNPHTYYTVNTLLYSDDTVGLPPETEATAPPEITPTPPPEPTPQPATYTVQVVDEQSGGAISGAEVTVGGTAYTTDENGVVVLKDAPRMSGLRIDYGGSTIYTDAAFTALPNRMNIIEVKPLNLEKEDLFAGNNGGTVIKGPVAKVAGYEIPTFETPFSMDYELFDSLKMVYDAENQTFQVLIGGKDELANVALDANSDSWKKTFEEFKEEYNRSLEDKRYKSYTGARGTIGIQGELDTRGFIEIGVEDDDSITISGGIVIKLKGKAEYMQYFIPGVYFVFALEGEVGGKLTWDLVNSSAVDPAIDFMGTINAALSPSAGVGAGARALLALEIGLKGKLEATYNFPGYALEDALKAELSASFYATLYALNHPFEHSQTIAKMELYPDFGAVEMMLDDPDMYTMNREYLNEVSLFNDDPDTYKTNLYPYSEVQTARLDDGRIIAVWTDDDTSRNSMDRTALYYSIYENGAWSAAEQIADDGTGDYEFDLQSSGNRAAIVWQNAESLLPDDISVDGNAALVGLCYAEFDGSAWGTPVNVTEGNSGYEYSPKLYYNGSKGYIVWMENGRNAAFPAADDTISIYGTTVTNGTVGEKTLEYEDMTLVYEIEAGNGTAACIADKDGNSATTDGIFYADGMECHTGSGVMAGLDYTDGGFCFSDNGTLRRSGGASSYASDVYTFGANSAARLIKNGTTGAQAIVYEVQEEFTSNLYASYYTDSTWSAPVKITEHTEKMRSWSAELDDAGNITVAAVLAAVDVTDDALVQSVRLSFETAEPKEEIEVLYIDSDGAAPGETAEFEIGIRNDSLAETLNVTITDESGNVLYSGTETSAEVIKVNVEIPEGFAKQTLTVYVDGAENESDTSDNSAAMAFGAADLSVGIRGGTVKKLGTASVIVTNRGCETAEDAVLTLKDAAGNVIGEEKIGALAGGERRTVRFAIDESIYSGGNTLISAEVTSAADAVSWNNSSYYKIQETDNVKLQLQNSSAAMVPGEIYKPNVTVYPAGTETAIYCTSSDESVASVDETGTITAVGFGKATISYMVPGSQLSTMMTVYVRETGTPEITAAQYTENVNNEGTEYEERSYSINVTVNTAVCLAEGETEQMITAVYDEDGTMICMDTSEVTAEESNTVNLYASNKRPAAVKVMIWNSLNGMKPAAYAAERAVAAGGGE